MTIAIDVSVRASHIDGHAVLVGPNGESIHVAAAESKRIDVPCGHFDQAAQYFIKGCHGFSSNAAKVFDDGALGITMVLSLAEAELIRKGREG